MKNELAVQTKCVNTLNDLGGHAFKSNNRFKAGILDIHCTINGKSFWIEWKYHKLTREGNLLVRATPKQQQFARKEREAGGMAYGLLFVQHAKERNKWAIVNFDPAAKECQRGFHWQSGPIKWSAVLSGLLNLNPDIAL